MRVATDLSLGYVILISLYLAGYVTISFKLNLFILRYLNTKPLGLQSLMDIPNKYLFRVLLLLTIISAFTHATMVFMDDPGDFYMRILMWAQLDIGVMLQSAISSNAIIQLILIGNPTLELPFSDSVTNIIYHSIQIIPLFMINLIGSLNGFLGPNYYRFRGIPIVKSESFVEIIFIIINATLFLIPLCIRIFIAIKYKPSCPNQLVSNNALLVSLTLTFPFLIMLHFSNINFKYIIAPNPIIVTCLFPLAIILSHEKCKKKFLHNFSWKKKE